MSILNDISTNIERGQVARVKELVNQALEEGIAPETILNDGLVSTMNGVGERFKNNEIFVPEVLIAARALKAGMDILKPRLVEAGVQSRGVVVIGTIKGDLHDIGKNLVKMMYEGKGLTVIDLGVDVAPEDFVNKAKENNADIISCSALLTTTMEGMAQVVAAAREAGIRDKVTIMVGGAPVTQEFCERIGADYYTPDAASASDVAVRVCAAKR